jgi:F-type H+-transporting ATPase subunit a
VSFEHPTVFSVFGIPVTSTVVTTWFMMLGITAAAFLAGRGLRTDPSRWQAVIEWCFSSCEALLSEVAGPTGKRYLPLVATLFVFILVGNLLGVVPFIQAPTADVNTALALALTVFFSVHYVGVRESGVWNYLRSFAKPSFVMLPFNILSQLTRTFSLAIRLFGNMLSHQIIVAVLLVILPLIVPAILEVFGLFIGALQAYIFTILSIVYIGGALRAEGSA